MHFAPPPKKGLCEILWRTTRKETVDLFYYRFLDSPEVCVSQYAKHCLKRLQKSTPITNSLRIILDAGFCFFFLLYSFLFIVQQARFKIFNPSMFCTSLEELMEMQATRFPDLKIPWIQKTLIKLIREKNGHQTEGTECSKKPLFEHFWRKNFS